MFHQRTVLSWLTTAAVAALVIAACAPAPTTAPTDTAAPPAPVPSDTPLPADTAVPQATAVIPNTGATGDTSATMVGIETAIASAVPPTQAGASSAPTIIASMNSGLGQILTDAKGMTLYAFLNDTPDVSTCSGICATNWPPLTVPQGTMPTAGDGVTVTLGTVTRADGSLQVTVNHIPVYYFASDTNLGDASGQGKGGLWYVLDASGNLVKTTVSTATPGSSDSMVGIVTETPVATPTTTYYP